jgi:hypothetical protein
LFAAMGGEYSRVGAICSTIYGLGAIAIWFAPSMQSEASISYDALAIEDHGR